MTRFVFASLLVSAVFSAPAVAQDADPLPVSVAAVSSASETFEAEIDSSKSRIMSDPATALVEARKAGRTAMSLPAADRALAAATSQWLEGEALTRLNRAEEAAPVIDDALQLVRKFAPGAKLHGDLLKSSASIASNGGRVEEALNMLHEAYGIYEKLEDKRSQAIVLNLIGSIYYEARDYERVLSYYNQAQEIYPEDLALTLSSHNNRGNAYSDMGQYDKAEEQFALALESAKAMESPLLEARILTNIASAQMMQGNYRKADRTALDGFGIATGDAQEWQPYLWGVRAQIALKQGQPGQARQFIERTFRGVDLENSSMRYRDYHGVAAEIYEQLGIYDKALEHLTAFKRLDDNGRDLAASTNSALLSAQFDNANRELTISRLEADEIQREMELSNSQTTLNYMLLALASALVVIAGLFYSISNTRRARREVTAANKQLYHSSTHDLLTELPNRAHFRELLADVFASAHEDNTQCAVMIVDLDRFKAVNDTMGHAVGDAVLCEVAHRLRSATGDYGQPVRLGGDEFAVIVRDVGSKATLAQTGEAIIESLSQPIVVDGATVSIGATIGGAIGPEDSDTIEQLTRCADLALYEGKKKGRGRYVGYRQYMQYEADERHILERDLREALKNGDLSIAYQSIVDATTEETQCYEALLRWNHPTRGVIAPDVFIPIAEEARLIHSIGSWVVRSACQEATNWPDHIKVAVNVSALQFEGGTLANTIVSALAASGLSPERLELEVTESVFLDDKVNIDEALDGLRALGVGLVLDDFGTGYSSLGYLRRASFSTIKIDRSFIRMAIAGSEESTAIIRAIVSMAGELGMDTTAEGVETTEDLEAIRGLGCSKLQGYFFSRPEIAPQRDDGDGAPVEDIAQAAIDQPAVAEPVRKAG